MTNNLHPTKRWRPETPDYFLKGTTLGTKQLWYNTVLVLHGMVEIYDRETKTGRIDIFEEDAVIGELSRFLHVCNEVKITPGIGVGTPEEVLKSNPLNWLAYVAGQLIPEVYYFINHTGISNFITEFRDQEQFLISLPTNKLTDKHIEWLAHINLIEHTIPSFLGVHGNILDTLEILERLHEEFEINNLKRLVDRS